MPTRSTIGNSSKSGGAVKGQTGATQKSAVLAKLTSNVGVVTKRSRPRTAGGTRSSASSSSSSSSTNVAMVPAATSLKRLSLSPSPATGLTGLVQNRYLTCFTDDFTSFYPVLDDTTIRFGLINLMTGKVDPALLGDSCQLGLFSTQPPSAKRTARGDGRRGGGGGSSPAIGRGKPMSSRRQGKRPSLPAGIPDREIYAVNSAVFSAMSVGALLLGQPPSHVHQYVAVAEASLDVCDAETMTPPTERVAAAHLLLAFATAVAGKADYVVRMKSTRQCYEARRRRGHSTPTPIGDVLSYRAIIDALVKPAGNKIFRVPSPSEAVPDNSGMDGRLTDAGKCEAEEITKEAVVADGKSFSTSGERQTANGRKSIGSNRDCSNQYNGRIQATGANLGEVEAEGRAVTPEGARGENMFAVSDESWRKNGGRRRPSAGLEAARDRSQWKRAEPLLMVSDIMTTLSKVPWSMKEEGGSRRMREDLSELRNLMVAENALVEERRFASGHYVSAPMHTHASPTLPSHPLLIWSQK